MNPCFERDLKEWSEKNIYRTRVIVRWLGNQQLVELTTPYNYLSDFIDISRSRQEEDISSLCEKYEKYGLTLRELAAGSIHSRDTISKLMKKVGGRLRKPGVRKKLAGIIYTAEDLHFLIKSKRDSGCTYREIANVLSAQQVLRNNKHVHWHPMMIKRILEQNEVKSSATIDNSY